MAYPYFFSLLCSINKQLNNNNKKINLVTATSTYDNLHEKSLLHWIRAAHNSQCSHKALGSSLEEKLIPRLDPSMDQCVCVLQRSAWGSSEVSRQLSQSQPDSQQLQITCQQYGKQSFCPLGGWHVLAYGKWMHNVAVTSWWQALTSQMLIFFFNHIQVDFFNSPPLSSCYPSFFFFVFIIMMMWWYEVCHLHNVICWLVCVSVCVCGGLCIHIYSSPLKSTDEQLPHKLLITSVNASCHLQWCNDHENCDLDLWKAIMWLNGLLPHTFSPAPSSEVR